MYRLTADNLHLWRGEHHVLRGTSFVLEGGQCLQVTGANGAGKTTLLRALCALTPLEGGRICWCGRDVATDPMGFHADIDYLGHDNGLKADLTATENLHFATRLKRRPQRGEIAAALARTGVAESGGMLLRRLSAGQRRRVALARLLLRGAALWILDEPSSNLDVPGQGLLAGLIEAHLAGGGAAVVATHQNLSLPATQVLSLALQ